MLHFNLVVEIIGIFTMHQVVVVKFWYVLLGWYQIADEDAKKLSPGDVVVIPANVKYWHGARKDSWFSHIAFEIPGENTSNEWLEPVNDEEYDKLD